MKLKHWLAIADALRLVRPVKMDHYGMEGQWLATVEAVSMALAALQSPRCLFNREKWIAYIMRE